MSKVWAFDLGASNGRLMLGSFDGEKINLEEIHRFPNSPVHINTHYYWDILRIFQEMKNGITKSVKMGHKDVISMGVDTWGVDFGLLSPTGELIGNPYSYRDEHFQDGMEEMLEEVSKSELFSRTGVEPAPINTICQLYTIQKKKPDLLKGAKCLLFTPNLISYFFSGVKKNEFTITSTSQLYSYKQKKWDTEMLENLNIPVDILGDITPSGTILGPTLDEINKELQIDPVQVINIAGHDTACALAALPINKKNTAFMSCGTWVLVGIQVEQPVVTEDALAWGFTNEGTLEGHYRLQKNNMGLWLIQQCHKVWEREGHGINYEEQNLLVNEAKPFQHFINPDDQTFFNPKNMVTAIQGYCINSGQTPPETKGEFLRCILESLAFKYQWVLEKLENLTNTSLEEIHMGGGGIQNHLLCQFIANATDRTVHAGPIEASAIGNALSQWIALGEIKDIQEARQIVQRSFATKTYYPQNQINFSEAYNRFLNLI
ncbi:rhamnulokinase [Metabacillus litoralis]|uniref:rhamnulokinase n=1 Tax=Metabacillus litoralis TaxID=152268 RepID=UPI0020414645|nr:FGGY-family carbohydrate kinase [Metabacillus litoralis]MCM3410856.1 FGGY-family carbohydrate kinase [Metabacillus litoralis]